MRRCRTVGWRKPLNLVNLDLTLFILEELSQICDVLVEKNYDLVTVVGNSMQSAAGVSSRIFVAIANYNLRMICVGANPHNMSFLVSDKDSTCVVQALHRSLFEN